MCGIGNPLFDLFYMICFASDLETVEQVEKEILENYYVYICQELNQRKVSLPKQLESYENYMEFYKDTVCCFYAWGFGFQLAQLQTKENSEMYIALTNHMQVGSYLSLKYNSKNRCLLFK